VRSGCGGGSPAAFADVDAAIARLRARGVTQIVVGGMSMGGNSALAYAATHPDVAGVIAMAPAHDAARATCRTLPCR
jgi:pimeloyl-ACP methyl ester carboxylesterase